MNDPTDINIFISYPNAVYKEILVPLPSAWFQESLFLAAVFIHQHLLLCEQQET